MCENHFQLVGDPVFTVYVGFAVRADLVNALSHPALNFMNCLSFGVNSLYEFLGYLQLKLVETPLGDGAASYVDVSTIRSMT